MHYYLIIFIIATFAKTVLSFEESGLPWIPFGFYQYTVTKPWDFNTTTDEAMNVRVAFTLKSLQQTRTRHALKSLQTTDRE